jgi:hypothetical protein
LFAHDPFGKPLHTFPDHALAPDGKTANLMLKPHEQALKCEVAPEAFAKIPNAWGARGATVVKLSALGVSELRAALKTAWQHAVAKRR